MPRLMTALGIGAIAGVIDVAPMLAQHLSIYACLSAWVHWVVLGVIITYVRIPLSPYIKGIVLAQMTALPIVLLIIETDPFSAVPIFIMSCFLGACVGKATAVWAKEQAGT